MSLTKSDLGEINKLILNNNKQVEHITNSKIKANNKHIKYLIDTKSEDLEEKLTQKIQQSKSDILNAIDPILKEVVASREERIIINDRLSELEEKFAS